MVTEWDSRGESIWKRNGKTINDRMKNDDDDDIHMKWLLDHKPTQFMHKWQNEVDV